MTTMKKQLISICVLLSIAVSKASWGYKPQNGIFAWKQLGYDFDNVLYHNSSAREYNPHVIHFPEELQDSDQFFIQPNNVPIGLEVYKNRVFITVPRRRYGIPSTLNYLTIPTNSGGTFSRVTSPLLKPYPDVQSARSLVSVYRPRVDACHRLWVVDTGHLEVPGVRKQIQPPAIIIYDLKTDKEILRQDLDPSILVNERSSAGLTSITVDADAKSCGDAFAYINDLATEGLVVFSLRTKESWRLEHASFRHDEQSMNFTASGHILSGWRDGLFSIALSGIDEEGRRKAYYHPMVSTQEFAVDTAVLKNRGASLDGHAKVLGNRGPLTQSGTHDFHQKSGVLFFANLPKDGIACWNVDTPMTPTNVVIAESDAKELGYIADLKVSGDFVWVLTNGIPRFIYNTQKTDEINYYVRRYSVRELIKANVCDARCLYPLLK